MLKLVAKTLQKRAYINFCTYSTAWNMCMGEKEKAHFTYEEVISYIDAEQDKTNIHRAFKKGFAYGSATLAITVVLVRYFLG
jgi:hypothetical protein